MARTATAAAAATVAANEVPLWANAYTHEHTRVINMPGDDDAMPLFISESRALAFT